jgi:hypothetical protein
MRRDKSFADDLIAHRGVVSSRVALLLRSAETKPSMPRFVERQPPPPTRNVGLRACDRMEENGRGAGCGEVCRVGVGGRARAAGERDMDAVRPIRSPGRQPHPRRAFLGRRGHRARRGRGIGRCAAGWVAEASISPANRIPSPSRPPCPPRKGCGRCAAGWVAGASISPANRIPSTSRPPGATWKGCGRCAAGWVAGASISRANRISLDFAATVRPAEGRWTLCGRLGRRGVNLTREPHSLDFAATVRPAEGRWTLCGRLGRRGVNLTRDPHSRDAGATVQDVAGTWRGGSPGASVPPAIRIPHDFGGTGQDGGTGNGRAPAGWVAEASISPAKRIPATWGPPYWARGRGGRSPAGWGTRGGPRAPPHGTRKGEGRSRAAWVAGASISPAIRIPTAWEASVPHGGREMTQSGRPGRRGVNLTREP